ncbi:Phage head-tail joining protein [Pseudoruegeria aquimaris]|uniref:Phage head-tail joining protein n=1 Tax=Pseudoruegeria aquimaris TaxID=393663 RepID=A0A1Y5RNI4_9RHOB|nr:head-tail adaptor protein [Pseudoruegeria aquimaris]SLN21686.1 Phage head-tail joining protein [Pseudoruegeria aquimaris]
MRPPQLNRRMVLESPLRTGDGAGGYSESWVAEGVLWATIQPRGGREAASVSGPLSLQRARITVRAAAPGSPARPRAGQRFREGTRIFVIEAVTEAEPAGRYLLCETREEVQA